MTRRKSFAPPPESVDGCKGCAMGRHHALHPPGRAPTQEEFAQHYVRTSGLWRFRDAGELARRLSESHLGYGAAYGGDGYDTRRGEVIVTCHGTQIARWTTREIALAWFGAKYGRQLTFEEALSG